MISTRITPWTLKLFAFIGPSLFGGILWWFIVQQALRGHVAFHQAALVNLGLFFLLGLVSLLMWLSSFLLVSYVGTWHTIRWTAAAVTSLPLFLMFPLSLWTFGAYIVVVLGLGWGIEVAADDAHNRLTVQPMRTFPQAVPAMVLAVIVAISVLYYQQLRLSSSTTEQLSEKLIDQTVSVAERALPLVYKSYTSGMTVDELIGSQLPTADSILRDINFSSLKTSQAQQAALNDRLAQLGIDTGGVTISAQESEATIRRQLEQQLTQLRKQTIDQARQELSDRFKFTIQPDEPVHDVLVGIIGYQFNRYVSRYVIFVPALLAVALFFILRVFTSLFQAVAVWGGWLLLKLFRQTGLVSVTHQTVPAEKLDWRHSG